MLRRLTALAAALPLFLLTMQGGSMACLPGSVAPTSSAPALTAAAKSVAHTAGDMAAMHHGMAMGDGPSTNESRASDAAAPASPSDQHQAPCPDRHSLGSCASMPSCATIAALPVADGPTRLAAEHAVVAAIPLAAPRAWGAAPELPPPRA